MTDQPFQDTHEDRVTQDNLPRAWAVTIPSTDANGLSNDVDLTKHILVAIQMPAAWTAAVLTFSARAPTTPTWANMYATNGNEFTVQAAAGRYIVLDPTDFAGVRVLRVRSGTSGTPVQQAANRELLLILRPV